MRIQDEPADVREAKEGWDCSVGASFSHQGACNFAILPRAPLSADSPLCLHEQPNHQHDHNDHLTQKQVAHDV